LAPPVSPQFFWLWSPTNLQTGGFFFHTNDDETGAAWNRRAVWQPDDHPAQHVDDPKVEVVWTPGTRHATSATITFGSGAGQRVITYTPLYQVFMLGLGYGHPKWSHGLNHGELSVERERLALDELDPRLPQHLHVQALCDVVCRDASGREETGRAVFEQLALGPHAPSGFKEMLDVAR
jgi:hypothetical protein